MARYHINPKTGNVNVCRAKKSCPFGDMALDHYSTPDLARRAYEITMESHSLAVQLLLKRRVIQMDVEELYRAYSGDTFGISASSFRQRTDERNRIEYVLRELPWNDQDGCQPSPEIVNINFPAPGKGKVRQGYSNDFLRIAGPTAAIYEALDQASKVWLKSLSTSEVKALLMYNLDAKRYAKITSGVERPTLEEEQFVKYLHSALAKAPSTSQSYVCYAGISEERQGDIRRQCEEGELVLDRVQSASTNPAQVNGFTHWNEAKTVVLEVKLSRLASLSDFVHRGEMEVLIPPGRYKVVNKNEDIKYLWPRGLGRIAHEVYVLEETIS